MQPTFLKPSISTTGDFFAGVLQTDSIPQWSRRRSERHAIGTSALDLDVFGDPTVSPRVLEITLDTISIAQQVADLIKFIQLGQMTWDIDELKKLFKFTLVDQEDNIPTNRFLDDVILDDKFISEPEGTYTVTLVLNGSIEGEMSSYALEDIGDDE